MRLIDADEAIKVLKEYVTEMEADIYYGSNMGVPEDDIEYAIEECKTVEAEPIKHGHWDYARNGCHKGLQCSACNRYSKNLSPFCQWCGAKMNEEINNEKTL